RSPRRRGGVLPRPGTGVRPDRIRRQEGGRALRGRRRTGGSTAGRRDPRGRWRGGHLHLSRYRTGVLQRRPPGGLRPPRRRPRLGPHPGTPPPPALTRQPATARTPRRTGTALAPGGSGSRGRRAGRVARAPGGPGVRRRVTVAR